MLIRVAVFFIPFLIIITIAGSFVAWLKLDANATGWNDVISIFALTVFYYWYLGKHLTEVAEKATYT